MRVVVKGRDREIKPPVTVAALLASMGLAAERTVVELNREIVPRDTYNAVGLQDGDTLELVEIVGGG